MKSLRFLVFSLLALVLSACSGKAVKTYSGQDLGPDELAVLTAGEGIQVSYVNGKKQTEYLLSQLDTDYALKPGKHRVVFYYTSVWAKSKAGSEGSRSELVESAPQVVEFDAQAGQKLSFDYAAVDNVRDAKVLASSFVASVVGVDGEVMGVSTIYDADAEAEKASLQGAAAVSASAGLQSGQTSDNALPALEGMKVLWERASAEDKKLFLKWAFK